VVPAQLRVLVTRRPKYACRRCSGAVVQAHAPEHVVPGGLPTEALIAQVIVAKFGDHLPFYRQAEIYARQGIRLDRATLGNWAGRACFHLKPIAERMRQHLAAARPPRRCSIPGAGRSGKASSGRSRPMIAVMTARARPSYCSTMRPDAVASMPNASFRLTRLDRPQGPWQLVHCWSHLRRRFVKLARNTRSPIAEAAIRQIAALYAIEATVRGATPQLRLAARRGALRADHRRLEAVARKAVVDDLLWLQAGRSHPLWARPLGGAYPVPRRWPPRARYQPRRKRHPARLSDPEKRPVRGPRGRGGNWALLSSLVATCRLNDVNPVAYIAETLDAIINGHPQSALEDLMPWRFRKTLSPNP
jgi:hypothetical protein